MENKILILLGSSCGGKDTLARTLESKGYNFVVSTTTRPIRDGESQKNPYNFVTNKIFETLIKENELIEYREYHTLVNNIPDIWYYGVEKSEIESNKNYVVVLDTVGLREFKEQFPENIISFYLHCNDEVRKQRCIARGDYNETEWNRRLQDDKIRFSNDIVKNEIDYVLNGEKKPEILMSEIFSIIKNK